jgi:hypothetical protein
MCRISTGGILAASNLTSRLDGLLGKGFLETLPRVFAAIAQPAPLGAKFLQRLTDRQAARFEAVQIILRGAPRLHVLEAFREQPFKAKLIAVAFHTVPP